MKIEKRSFSFDYSMKSRTLTKINVTDTKEITKNYNEIANFIAEKRYYSFVVHAVIDN